MAKENYSSDGIKIVSLQRRLFFIIGVNPILSPGHLKSGRQRQENQRERCLEQGMWDSSKSQKRKRHESCLRPSEKNTVLLYLNFSPLRAMFRLVISRTINNQLVLFKTPTCAN